MKQNLTGEGMPRCARIITLISALLFLIGSVYYSYILLRTAYAAMHRLIPQTNADGSVMYKLEFSLTNINALAVVSVLSVAALCLVTVLLAIFALKNKYHFLAAAFSVTVMTLQWVAEPHTALQEFTFARYVLRAGNVSYDIFPLIKYVPYAAALVLSVACVAAVMLFRRRAAR